MFYHFQHFAVLPGAPNYGFFLSTLKTLFRLSRVISDLQKCILSGAIKFVSVRSSQQALQYYYLKNFRCNLKFYESENFSHSLLQQIFESENFRFPFSMKNSLAWGVKCERLNLRRNLSKLRNLYMNGMVVQDRFQPSSRKRKLQVIFASPNRYFTENSRWMPLFYTVIIKTRRVKRSCTLLCLSNLWLLCLSESFLTPYLLVYPIRENTIFYRYS